MSRIDYVLLSHIPQKKIGEFFVCKNCGDWITDKRRTSYCCQNCADSFFRKCNHSAMRTWLIFRRGAFCEKCGRASETRSNYDLTLDHILPIALGGEQFGNESNLQLLCPTCNKEKTSRDISEIALQKRIARKQENNRKIGEFV
jgi:5-methylcytosine-specific restriction endonuclease McrA